MAKDTNRKWRNIQARIERAVKRGQAKGIKLVNGTFGCYQPGSQCCALTMVVADSWSDTPAVAAKKLGIEPLEAWDIVWGFDASRPDAAPASVDTNSPAFQVGQRLRRRLQPANKE
jgi:hypothetical protein